MKVFLIIMGVLTTLCGIALATTPLLTFWEANYFFIVLLLVYGVSALVRGIARKEFGSSFFFSILSILAGLLILFVPGLKFLTSTTIIYMMAVWFLLQGVITIVVGLRKRKLPEEEKKGWVGGVLIGVLGLILGIYSLFHPVALAFSVGMLLGIYFIISGINLITLGVQVTKKEK